MVFVFPVMRNEEGPSIRDSVYLAMFGKGPIMSQLGWLPFITSLPLKKDPKYGCTT